MDKLISEQAVIKILDNLKANFTCYDSVTLDEVYSHVKAIPSAEPKKCKDCKYFEYDSVAKVDGIPLIVAHEICNKWGGGCQTSEDGYCYLFESEDT